VKLTGPAVAPTAIHDVDLALVSHDHHPDNLDSAGREFLHSVGRTLTTRAGADRLGGNALGLDPWSSTDVESPNGQLVTVTAVPAQHGPDGSDPVMGPVIGFVLKAPAAPSLYISGDNASLRVVEEIVARLGSQPLAVLFAGAARIQSRFDGADLTLSSAAAAEAAGLLGARAVVPLHFEGWAHFSEGAGVLTAAFAAAGLSQLLHMPVPGERVAV
jgi:L-ascorbate metabolism protein UlaG (beta-lactamase superfamily)